MNALIVGVFLTGQIHLYWAEVFHHHDEGARVCQISHQGGTYLHAVQNDAPACPLCQIVRNGSVRPAVQSIVQKPEKESDYQPLTRKARYSPNLAVSLLARAPPLS